VTGQVCAKMGALAINNGEFVINFFTVSAYCLLIVRGLVWLLILNKIKLSVAYPLVSSTYVFLTFVGYYCFNEPLSQKDLLGIALIIGGILTIGVGEKYLRRKSGNV
jgi:undecaprenyl phosphate-alpha-L-ara4N flippase subunit ArnE